MILMHLPGELGELREVCQRFIHVITNSVPIMRKFTLCWNTFSDQGLSILALERKFCRVRFLTSREEIPEMLTFFRSYHPTLSKIDLPGADLEPEELHEILSLVAGAVEKLSCFSSVRDNAELPRIVLPKLKSLTLGNRSARFFNYTGTDSKVFMPKLREFSYYGNPAEPHDEIRDVLVEFLRRSDRLHALTIRNSLARRMLMEVTVTPFTFQLKELTLEMHDFPMVRDNINIANMLEFMTRGLPRFLASQRNSLTQLAIRNAVLHASDFDAILQLKIKDLEVSHCWIEWEDGPELENQTIEKFKFSLHYAAKINQEDQRYAIDRVLYSCKNLRSVKINNVNLSLSCTESMSQLNYLTNLKLYRCL